MSLDIAHLRSVKRGNFQLDVEQLLIEDQQAVSIIGANGSGKTTLMETLLGLAASEIRDVSISGVDIATFDRTANSKANLGVQLQKAQYNKELNVQDLVKLYRAMYGKASKYIYSALNIGELAKLRYEKLSRGQKQRVDLYLALSHEPRLILLDEPNTGLDARYQTVLSELLHRLKANNSTILMASHTKSEIDMCEKVILMEAGRVKYFDSFPQVLASSVGQFKLQATFTTHEHFQLVEQFLLSSPEVIAINSDREKLEVCAYLKKNIIDSILTVYGAEYFASISASECALEDIILSSNCNRREA